MKFFCYGSLKRGQTAHHFLESHNAVFVREAVTTPDYHLYDISWFPGVVLDESMEGGVHGEVYEVSSDCLDQMDRYEGAPHLFRRETITLEDGEEVIAYLFNQGLDGCQRVESGVWNGS